MLATHPPTTHPAEVTASTPQPPNAWEHTPYLAKTLHLAEAALVDYLLSVFTSGEWQEAGGVKSFTHWITLRTGVSPSRARHFQLLINRAEELPTMMTAYREATISLDQAIAIATYTPTGYDDEVTHLGAKLTVTQLRRLLRNYTWPAEAADDAPPAATTQTPPGQPNTGPNPDRPATLTMHTRNGRFHAHLDAPEADGALVKKAILEATDALFQAQNTKAEHGSDDNGNGNNHEDCCGSDGGNATRSATDDTTGTSSDSHAHSNTPAHSENTDTSSDATSDAKDAAAEYKPAISTPKVTTADGFMALALQSLNALDPNSSRAANYRTYIHLDVRGAAFTSQHLLPDHIADKLTCDGVCQPVWEKDGSPVNVGREHRIVPARTRRLLEHRDRGCRFPGCTNTRHLEAHHIHHWRNGGRTDMNNLVLLCSHHHDEHHKGTYLISGDPCTPATDGGTDPDEGLVFTYPNTGKTITLDPPEYWKPPQQRTNPDPYQAPTGEAFAQQWVHFQPNHN